MNRVLQIKTLEKLSLEGAIFTPPPLTWNYFTMHILISHLGKFVEDETYTTENMENNSNVTKLCICRSDKIDVFFRLWADRFLELKSFKIKKYVSIVNS